MDFNEFLDDGTDEEYNKNINKNILDDNVMNMSLIIMEGKYDAIDTDDFHVMVIISSSFLHRHIPFK